MAYLTLLCILGSWFIISTSAQKCKQPISLPHRNEDVYALVGQYRCRINITSVKLKCGEDYESIIETIEAKFLEGKPNRNSATLECFHLNETYQEKNIPHPCSPAILKSKIYDIVTLKVIHSYSDFRCYKTKGLVYKLSEEPLAEYIVLVEEDSAIAFLTVNDKIKYLPINQKFSDASMNRVELKYRVDPLRPFSCENDKTIHVIFPNMTKKKNLTFVEMMQDCEIRLQREVVRESSQTISTEEIIPSDNTVPGENRIPLLNETPPSYLSTLYDMHFIIISFIAFFGMTASFVNVIVNYSTLRKIKGKRRHICCGIFFSSFALRMIYEDLQNDQDKLAEVILLKTNEMDLTRKRMIIEDFMKKRESKYSYDYIQHGSSGYLTPIINHYEI
ncbi:hypothetical protein JTB14_022784 [Gonioctena quinquepunctata]|nr:hypothetical protein JTB14_022784 [Gonioctena quinquepunctata]